MEDDLGHDLAAVHLGATRAVVGRGRVLEDAVDQASGAFHAVVEKPHHLLLVDAESAATAEQRGHDVHPEQWLADVVRRHRGEVTQLVLAPALLRDVERHTHQARPERQHGMHPDAETWIASRHMVSSVISADSASRVSATRSRRS